jgi:hypothetical protein
VTYAENHTAHIKIEFGFDMVQVAKNRYASQQYHDFIGFQVSKPLLERVFPVVYGVQLKDVIPHEDLAIGSYRFAVSRLIPEMTQVALKSRKTEMMKEQPDFAKEKFLYRLSRTAYEKEWGKDYTKPGFGARILALLFRFMPKIGPFKGLGFKNPTPHTEDLYFKSVNATVDQYRTFLHAVGADSLRLTNCDLDDGKVTAPGEYSLADDTYAKLLEQLTDHKFESMTPQLRANIVSFYSEPSTGIDTKKSEAERQKLEADLDQLKSLSLTPAAEASQADRNPPANGPALCSVGQ